MSKKVIFSTILIVAVIAGLVLAFNGNDEKLDFVKAKKGNVVYEVDVTGTVKPTQGINLAFEKGGRITSVNVDVGDRVGKGVVLASVFNSDIRAQLLQAKADLNAEKANLANLKKGAKTEEVRVKEVEITDAKQSLKNYYQDGVNILEDAYTKANDAVKIKTDAMFDNDDSDSPELSFSSTNAKAESKATFGRLESRNILASWSDDLAHLKNNTSNSEVFDSLKKAKSKLNNILGFLSNLQNTLDNPIGLSQSDINTYKSNINSARANINTAIESIDNQIQLIESQKIAVTKKESELELLLAGPTKEELDAQQAKVERMKSQVDFYQSELGKTFIITPFSGIVTKISKDPGEIVSANDPVIHIIGEGPYQIEANITESDISGVSVGKTADVTLDAYGNDLIFEAEVTKIDLSETVIEGVPTYKATLSFKNKDEKIISGLTANVDILSEKKENVLYVPTRNIIKKEEGTFVKLLKNDGTVSEVEVQIGLRGSGGRTEIISGLEGGDKIVIE